MPNLPTKFERLNILWMETHKKLIWKPGNINRVIDNGCIGSSYSRTYEPNEAQIEHNTGISIPVAPIQIRRVFLSDKM